MLNKPEDEKRDNSTEFVEPADVAPVEPAAEEDDFSMDGLDTTDEQSNPGLQQEPEPNTDGINTEEPVHVEMRAYHNPIIDTVILMLSKLKVMPSGFKSGDVTVVVNHLTNNAVPVKMVQ